MTYSSILCGALLLLCSACGPGPANTTESTTDATSGTTSGTTTSTVSDATSTSEAPTTSGTTTTTGETTTTTGTETTAVDTTTGGACVMFSTDTPFDVEPAPVQITCDVAEELCPSDQEAPLFVFDEGPGWDDSANSDDLARVHCLVEAFRDRTPGRLSYRLSWPVLGYDVGSLEIVGGFVIARRETANDFNYSYDEVALWLEPSTVFEECRAMNTATAAWQCLRPYINLRETELECVPEPLACG